VEESELILDLLDDWEQRRALGEDISARDLSNDPAIVRRLCDEWNVLQRMVWMDQSLETSRRDRRRHLNHLIGDLLESRYELQRILGSGGFAVVWLARDTRLGEQVALKIPYYQEGRASSECAWREFQTANSLTHQHIVPIIRMGDHRGNFFIVSEYIDGETLADRIRRGPIEPIEAMRIIREVATVLAFIHRKGLIHCDLKPSNILLDKNGHAYVTDFGISLRTVFSKSIIPKTTAGTLLYMAPEQLVPESPIDSRCDIYSLGLILFEMLTGKRPFAMPSVRKPGDKARARIAPRPSSMQQGIPKSLDWVIDWCLATDPGHRYFSAYELLEKLAHPEWPRRKTRPWQEWERAQPDTSSQYRGLGLPHPIVRVWYRASNWISDRIYFAKLRIDHWIEPYIELAKRLARQASGIKRSFGNLWIDWYESVFAFMGIAVVLTAIILSVSFANSPQQSIPAEPLLIAFSVIGACLLLAITRVRQWQYLALSMLTLVVIATICWYWWPHAFLKQITMVLDPASATKSTKN
jgi:serine/threonine protein kinase